MVHSVLQQLEILKIVEKDPKGGRRITSDGQVRLPSHSLSTTPVSDSPLLGFSLCSSARGHRARACREALRATLHNANMRKAGSTLLECLPGGRAHALARHRSAALQRTRYFFRCPLGAPQGAATTNLLQRLLRRWLVAC